MDSSPKSLNLYPIDYPFETLVGKSSQKLILNPDFQRKYKWDKDGDVRASRFIESCLMRIPLPACYFAEDDNGNHIVIDGVQRITTIKRFFNNEFRLEGLSVFTELEGKQYSELGKYKAELESTTIRCIVLRNENPQNLIQEIFSRLNQGAVELEPQEIRHAVYPGSFDELLSELGKNPIVQNFSLGQFGKKSKDGREPDEMILRYFALQSDLDDYEGTLSTYLDNFMRVNQNLSKDKVKKLKKDFEETLFKCELVFGNNLFVNTASSRGKQGLVYYDLLMWSFKKISLAILKKNKNLIKKKYLELCNDKEFDKTLSGGLQKKTSILKRRKLWENKLSDTEANIRKKKSV